MIVERIYLSPARKSAQIEPAQVELVAGRGIEGDRHFDRSDWPGQNLTLVEAEEIERFCAWQRCPIDYSLSRRNLVTRGIRLNALVGRRFWVGEIELLGVELCEPCSSLGKSLASATVSASEVVNYWTGRGGLRAKVTDSGRLQRGAAIRLG